MTGFFSQEVVWQLSSGKKLSLVIEVKSLNNRFFELSCKLPSFLSGLENQIASIFKQVLIRGKIFFTIKVASDEALVEQVKINEAVAKSYVAAFEQFEKIMGKDLDPNAVQWFLLPRFFNSDSDLLLPVDVEHFLQNFCKIWASKLQQDRIREGASITEDLDRAVTKIESFEKKILEVNSELLQKVKTALEEHKAKLDLSKEDEHLHKLEQKKYAELEALLDKTNINEEITRSEMHLKNIKNLFRSSEYEVGKKLEFTLQELLRETNTISSKMADYQINSSCVEIKFELEKLREQSQNIV